jgi:hypothetical protein
LGIIKLNFKNNMDTSFINYGAVFVAALSSFLIGGIWYSPAVFGTVWMKENGLTEAQLKERNMLKVFGLAFLLALIASFNLVMFLGPESDISAGGFYGFLAGFGWVATFVGTHYLFEKKSFTLFLINAGYSVVALTVMGVILGVWR